MKQSEIFKKIIISIFLITIFIDFLPINIFAQTVRKGEQCISGNQCKDCKDNNGDGKADFDGNDTLGESKKMIKPDPSCFAKDSNTETKEEASGLVPCTDYCGFDDVFILINKLLEFFMKTLLIPIFMITIMYAGFKYITAEGNPAKTAKLKTTFGNLILGMILILCAWLIVRTVLYMLGYTEGLLFFIN